MKTIQIIMAILSTSILMGQNVSEINSDLKIPDSLSHKSEIRIYQGGGTTTYSSVFVMFKDDSDKWSSHFYEHFNGLEPQVIKRQLIPISDSDFVFQNFIRSYALDLPTMSKINWKLEKRNDIIIDEGIDKRGKAFKKYYASSTFSTTVDGKIFYVQVRAHSRNNSFSYSSPDYYLEEYPEVDELQFMCEILQIVREEFNIWKTE